MTREEVIPFVETGIELLGLKQMYKIANITRTGPKFDKYKFQLMERFCANAKYTWRLMDALIARGHYPICTTCGRFITKRRDRYHHPDALTMGHALSKLNGGTRHISNVYPEHAGCNLEHGSENIADEQRYTFVVVGIGLPTRYRPFKEIEILVRHKYHSGR